MSLSLWYSLIVNIIVKCILSLTTSHRLLDLYRVLHDQPVSEDKWCSHSNRGQQFVVSNKRICWDTSNIIFWQTVTYLQNTTFECTSWDLFTQQYIEYYLSTVLFHIQGCVDNVTVDKYIQTFPNNMSWMTKEDQLLLRDNEACRSWEQVVVQHCQVYT